MNFNSYEFLFLFLPAAYVLSRVVGAYGDRTAALVGMALLSALFYGYASLEHLALLAGSIVVNYAIARRVSYGGPWLAVGIAINLAVLGVVKYTSLATSTLYDLGLASRVIAFSLPLAISFYTFHQISFLVDLSRGRARFPSFPTYAVYVLFFPQLVAGPIVRYHEISGRLERQRPFPQRWSGMQLGLLFVAIGLSKKVIIADTLGTNVNMAWGSVADLSLIEAWVCLVAFGYQIYFDFSGYTDIAQGAALLFGIRLPINFNSPYKAASITEFWRRWHMSLSRFLRDYLYIPLGGNRRGAWRQKLNLMVVMVLGGIWHGAGWSFALWGFLHGLYLVIHRLWSKGPISLPRPLAVAVTFVATMIAWVPFRAPTFDVAMAYFSRLTSLSALALPERLAGLSSTFPWLAQARFTSLPFANVTDLALMAAVSWIVFFAPNSRQLAIGLRGRAAAPWVTGMLFAAALIMMRERPLEFVYFRF